VNKIAYDSLEARELVDKLMEKFALETFKASNTLAKQRGKYDLFDGSEYSKGIILGKDAAWFEKNSENAAEWKALLEDVKVNGLRFAYHLAPAPNTSTA